MLNSLIQTFISFLRGYTIIYKDDVLIGNSSFNQLNYMATFFVQTDKDFYFAGETVNGNIFLNVGSMIVGAQGLSLKFTGYECVKWVEADELHRPSQQYDQNGTRNYDPIDHIPSHQLTDSDNLGISDCESQDNRDYDHRPKYVRTSSDRYFKMKYLETRNMFTRQKNMVYNCSGFAPGQYSFPFSFKTFEGWPASFNHHTYAKKGVIIYHMVAAIEPVTPQFNLCGGREITLRETRVVTAQQRFTAAQLKSCCCIGKGPCQSKMYFAKDGYMPGQMVQVVAEVDNSQCAADISSVTLSVTNRVTLRSGGHETSDFKTVFSKQISGMMAGQSKMAERAYNETFMMPNNNDIKPTCSGQLLSSQYFLSMKMNHDIMCQCCSDVVSSSIPVIIFPIIPVYSMPSLFQNNWTPQVMPMTNMQLPNNWAPNPLNSNNNPLNSNPNPLNSMGGQFP